MKHILCFGAFLVCFTTVLASPRYIPPPTGQPRPLLNFEKDKEANDGLKLILENLSGKVNNDPAKYFVKVALPDLKVYKQLVNGWMYWYYWDKEIYTITCRNENAKCDEKELGIYTEQGMWRECKAKYSVDFNGKNKEFTEHCFVTI